MAKSKKIQIKALPLPGLPDVSLNIGGKERQLAFDMGAIFRAEELTGMNLLRAASFDNLSFLQVRGLLYAALLKDDPTLDIAELNDWPILHNMRIIAGAIAEAWYGSVPKADEADVKAAPAGEEKAQAKEA